MEVKQLTLGAMASNCYLIQKDKQVIIVDPGDLPNVIIDNIDKNDTVVAILLTHGHFDHIGALNKVYDKFKCPVYAHKDEKTLLNNPNLSFYENKLDVKINYISESFEVSDFKIIVHHTPGHTKGSVMYQIKDHLFTGDTIFDLSIGRVDFPTGDVLEMQKSLQYIKTLSPDLKIYPGHNNVSTLGRQFQYNPYLNR